MLPEERDRLARVEEQLKALQFDVNDGKVDIKSILARIDSASGGWKVLITLLSVAGAIGAIISALAHNLIGR